MLLCQGEQAGVHDVTLARTLAASSLMSHDLAHVQNVMKLLEAHGIITWLFGGWAEELHGLIAPREHRDIDLLYRGDTFAPVDRFLRLGNVEEIIAKRFSHKRAFVLDGVMTEIIIVGPDLTTTFRGERRFAWPADVFDHHRGDVRVTSSAALTAYRAWVNGT
jgi:hypothetical protein